MPEHTGHAKASAHGREERPQIGHEEIGLFECGEVPALAMRVQRMMW